MTDIRLPQRTGLDPRELRSYGQLLILLELSMRYTPFPSPKKQKAHLLLTRFLQNFTLVNSTNGGLAFE